MTSLISLASSNTSKRQLFWTGLAAVFGCAACCAVPLLAAAGVGGGGMVVIAHLLRPGAELFVGIGFAAMTFGLLAMRGRRSVVSCSTSPRGCRSADSAERSLFESGAAGPDEPIVCTGDLRDKPAVQAQVDGYRAAFRHLLATELFDGGFRWIFARSVELESELRSLAKNERACCAFFQFDLRATGDRIAWEVRGDQRARSVLEEFSRLPERLAAEPRRGHDAAALKEHADVAGLAFAADTRRR